MRKVVFMCVLLAVTMFSGCSKSSPSVVDKFIGTWVWSQALNDATFKGDGTHLITIKKTSETSVSADYSYRFSGTYGGNAATQTSDGSFGVLNVESNTLVSTNVLYNIQTVLIYQKSGSPVTLKENYSYKFSTLKFEITSSNQLQITQTPDNGSPSIRVYTKQ